MAPRKLIGLTGNIATGKSNVLSEMRALGAVIIDVIFWAFAFLRMGTIGLTAQALGRADDTEQGGGAGSHPPIREPLGRAL